MLRHRLYALAPSLVPVAMVACGGHSPPSGPAPRPRNERIVVTGATGRQGGAVARHLLARGFRVTAVTRNEQQPAALELRKLGADLVVADLNEPSSLDAALAGAYGVFSVQATGDTAMETRQGIALADHAKARGIRHFVYSSVGSANRRTGIPHFESKWAIEEHLRAIGLPHTILRPVAFMENWDGARQQIRQDRVVRSPLSPNTRLEQVAVDDIAAFAVQAFEHPREWLGRAIDIAGDDLTMAETAALMARMTGKPIRYEQIPWPAFEQAVSPDGVAMYRWFERVGYNVDVPALRRRFSFVTSFEAYLRAHGWAEAR
jgi:uncharacterized protein YbjT (DUF2867 family)